MTQLVVASFSRIIAPEPGGAAFLELPEACPPPPERRGASQLIVGDVVNLECAGVGVAQHEIGRARGVDRRDRFYFLSAKTVRRQRVPYRFSASVPTLRAGG